MRDADWDQLFLHFVRKRGLRDVEALFQRYVRPQQQEPDDGMSVTQQAELQQTLIEDLANFAADNDASVYTDTYDQLATWVDNSLDMYRPELRRLLHPVFVRCYLQLVELDAGGVAAALLARYRSRVLASQGGLRRRIASDLQQLSGLAGRQQLRSSPWVAGLAGSRVAVPLSPPAHELLLRFLHTGGGRMLPLLAIINGHVDLQVVEGLPRGAAAAEEEGGEEGEEGWGGEEEEELDAAGGGPPDAATAVIVNRTEVKLGLLQGNVEDLYREQQEKQRAEAAAAGGGEAAGAAGQAAGGDGQEPATKKAKKAAEKAAAAAAAAATKSGPVRAERMEHPPYLPRLSDEVVAACLRDIGCRAAVSAAAPPSCAFFTFVNAKQTLTCCAFNRDGSKIVAGFTDSSVRLYDMPTITAHHAQLRRARPRPPHHHPSANGNTHPADPASPSQAATAIDDEVEPPGTSYLYGHTAAVHAVDMTVDQRLVLSGASDGTIRVWGAEFGACLAVYPGHVFPVWDVACCPVGHWFASAGADRVARLWVTERTAPLRLLAGHGADVDLVRWHPNCSLVATGSADRTVRLWDVREGKCVRYLSHGLYGSPTALALSPDGRHVAVGTDSGRLAVWDLGTARRLAASQPAASHAGAVWALSYSQGEGTLLASGGADETVRLWRNDLAEPPAEAGGAGASGSTPAGGPAGAASAGAGKGQGTGAEGGVRGAGSGPYGPVGQYRTKSSPVVSLHFNGRNLLLAAGPFHRRGPIAG
ncbi:hypothetical protein Agub_g5100 [Astrephomene gubernaculifera]|uniref:TFIID subunit TAF5 NTD2 domain-containing protein n=1 Tax=Astrephomene gubernaculifera TaxID=47775 RepID=A0AAD3HKB2_9CHLO|nr:hypothetical protein Agub_g5100 [Astrephomene gubernaculifera]